MAVSVKFAAKVGRIGLCGTTLFLFCSLICALSAAQNYSTQYSGTQNSASADDRTVGEILAAQNANGNAHQSPPTNVIPTNYTIPVRTENPPAVQAANWQENGSYGVVPASRNEPVSAPAPQPVPAPAPAPAPQQRPTYAEPAPLPNDYPAGEMAPLSEQNLIAFSETVTLSEGTFQQLTIIDPIQKVFCVYHINMATGQIELKSARKIEWDLQLIFLNSKKPLPQEVQAILNQSPKRR